MNRREAKIYAIRFASSLCMTMDMGFAPDDMPEKDVEKLLKAFDALALELHMRADRLEYKPKYGRILI